MGFRWLAGYAVASIVSGNPLKALTVLGQSIWLDYIQRQLVTSDELRNLIEVDGVSGITSNPSIFQRAVAGSSHYEGDIRSMALSGRSVEAIYDALSVKDVQSAADVLHAIYVSSDAYDGYVSLEVDPHLAHDTEATIADARRLWALVNRPNILVKVPATREGLPAIRQLISEGINVNVTLLFALARYRQVAEAYLSGLEVRTAQQLPVKPVASVASFFVSRIDSLLDPKLEQAGAEGGKSAALAESLRGKIATANAKLAYQIYKENAASLRFKRLAELGARPQRLLWASTSTKNIDYSDVKYVEALIGPHTVNTLPMATLGAYRDHGDPRLRLENDIEGARRILSQLPEVGIDLDEATQQLEEDGVDKFSQSFDKLMATLAEESARHRPSAQ